MSATAKPSRFWGTTPRRIKWFTGVLMLLLIGAAFVIAILLFRDFVWKFNATYFAAEAGRSDAKMYYAHGSRRLLELTMIEEPGKADVTPARNMFEMDPTGRQVEGFDLYLYYVSPSGGAAQRITGESYVKAFNHWMRTICANPAWYGTNGEPLSNSAGTNRPPFKHVPD